MPNNNKKSIGAIVKTRTLALQRAISKLVQRTNQNIGQSTTGPKVIDFNTIQKAKQGDATAQFDLGMEYRYGVLDVHQDYTKAVYWFRKAAEQGHAWAQYILGIMYANGQGVPQDYTKAIKWHRKAAEQGLTGAQYNLGVMYAEGWGVLKDHAKAAEWYRKAAEQGNAAAQYSLGVAYENGKGVPIDYAKAAKWYRKAAKREYDYGNQLSITYQANDPSFLS